jgi:hypothetical protein
MPEPKSPVINGLESHETNFGGDAVGQPQYIRLPALVSRDAQRRVLSRWEFTPEEREMIAQGADVYVALMTFGHPYQPTIVFVANKEDRYGGLKSSIARDYRLPVAEEPPGDHGAGQIIEGGESS